MKVHILTENALEALRTNLKGNLKHYAEPSNGWIGDYFGEETAFEDYKTDFSPFELKMDSSLDLGHNDVNNTITLYSAMQNLSDAEALDERLWAGMCHFDFWVFLRERYQAFDSRILNEQSIKSRFFFSQSRKRSLITNSLSKLWWIGRLTYDCTREDPFELTKYLATDYATKVLMIFSNNFIGNPSIAVGLFSALILLENEGFKIKDRPKRDIYYEVVKYLNILSGTHIIDYFSSEEICDKIIGYMRSLS